MKTRSRIACISAAVAALVSGGSLQARNLDFNEATLADDGLGAKYSVWDTGSANWLDAGVGTTWVNAPADSAIIGNATNAFVGATKTNNLILTEAIVVQDITLGIAANGATYNVVSFALDFPGSTLTLNGNVTKTAGAGNPQLALENGLILSAGDHTFAANDTGGDAAPELTVNAPISGSGNVVVNNGSGFVTWGTTAFTNFNSYTGATSISKGRLIITKGSGLGGTAAGTTISNLGTLSVGGAGTAVQGGVDIAEPITVTRNTYTGGDFGMYGSAITFANSGGLTHTISGPLVIDSSDARIRVDTSTLVLPGGNITLGANGAAGVLSFTGDFAGFVEMRGSNPALATNGILITGGVEVRPESDAALGGPTAPITMRGGFFRPFAGMTTFGSHPINTTDLGIGISVPAGQSFTFDRAITAGTGGVLGKRGDGTLSIVSSVTGTGQTFWDAGVVNVNSALTIDNLHLRSPVVNIGDGGVVTLRAGFNAFGQDSTGTNGGPDKAVVNLTGNGQLIQTNGSDFNISDNANTEGTVNIYDNAVFTTGGITWLGKNNNTVGRINQYGGTININRTGNFGFVIADGRGAENPTGHYNLNGGTFNSAGEVYVGEGGSNAVGGTRAHGHWTQTGGTANVNQWFVVGRESAVGHVDISGGTLNHNTTGNMALGDSNAGGEVNTIKVHGTAAINNNAGSVFVGNNGGAVTVMDVYETANITSVGNFVVGRDSGTGTMTIKDDATLTVTNGELWVGQNQGKGTLNIEGNAKVTVQNNWLAIGRANANSVGVLNLSGGTLTKAGGGNIAVGSGGTGTFNQTGGTLISSGTRVGEASNGTMNLTGGTAMFTGGFSIGHVNNVVGTLNVGGTANVTVPAVVFGVDGSGTGGGSLNLSGNATLTAASFTAGANSTGAKTFKFDGGTLVASGDATNFMDAKITGVVSAGGARVNTNGRNVTVNSALTHDAGLAGVDGGLVKSGAGTLRLAGANTYTGGTTVSAGTLHADTPGSLPEYATAGRVTLATGTTLAVSAGGAGEWTAGDIATVRSTVAFPAGSALGVDTTNAATPFAYNQVLSGPVGLTKLGGGSLVLGGANTYTGPTVVNGTGSLVLTSAAFEPVLTGAGGAVVNSGRLVFDYAGTTSPLAQVAAALDASYDASTFTDPNQRIRTTNAIEANHGLGYVDDGALLAVAYTWYGDANVDGTVNADDYALVDRGAARGLAHWFNGDFNYDGVVSSADYLRIDTSYGILNPGVLSPSFLAARSAEFGSEYVSQLVAAVPEPTGVGLLVSVGAAGALGRRRNRR
jgi:autotransporter-associated beta strand protein